jgi:transcriptional regulator with XRE-family HTH domain
LDILFLKRYFRTQKGDFEGYFIPPLVSYICFMPTIADMSKTIHQGRNVKRFREMLGIKQEGLALELGDDWNQKKISLLEQKEEIEPRILEQVANALKVPVEAIKNFDQEAALNIFSNTYHDNSSILGTYNFNPIDKLLEALDENKKLYERLLQSEREKSELLQKLLDEKNK